MKKYTFGIVTLLAVLSGIIAYQERSDKSVASNEKLDEAIKKLGGADALEVSSAIEQLAAHEHAVPALRKAAKSADSAVAKRAEAVLKELMDRPGRRYLELARDHAARGKLDLVFESLARLEAGQYDQWSWNLLHAFMSEIRRRAQEQNPELKLRPVDVPQLDLWDLGPGPKVMTGLTATLRELTVEEQQTAPRAYWIRTKDLKLLGGSLGESMAIATRKVIMTESRHASWGASFVYAGEAEVISRAFGAILVCDGDVKLGPGLLQDCIVLIRGDLRVTGFNTGPDNSHVVTRGRIVFENDCMALRSGIIEHERKPLGYLSFFEVSDLGLHVIENGKGLRVNNVDKETPFARAGLRWADGILAVDGTPVQNYEEFRRLIRQKWIEQESFTLHLDKDGSKEHVRIEWNKTK
jgi:hypothetical protein